ncbi:energy transducer TonB [Aquimarina celericrescens]|uniref:Energy transducer TonB n=1 Tax=Aquimarina celericrescens TaxID=1964542 RepID=A0ABW5ASH7_9FLAO|nr:energy transducer TonB [Aquimarina celericrescens]
MKKFYKISIPKPCHEDWNKMTPKEKGRFCNSCAKTVIDFTKMSSSQVQDFIHANQNTKMCGHFKRSQLDTIHLSIPIEVIKTKHSLKKSFLLALLIAMGTTLISCTNYDGKKQKIKTVEITENSKSEECPVSLTETSTEKCEKTTPIFLQKMKTRTTIEISHTKGEIIPTEKEIDILEPSDEEIEGDFEIIFGLVEPDIINVNSPVPAHLLETYPAFDKTAKEERTQETFSEQMRKFVTKHYNTNACGNVGLKGTQRIYTQFEINKEGIIKDIKIRAPHPSLEKETERMIQKIPQLIPGTYKNQPVRTKYSLPIIFKLEE